MNIVNTEFSFVEVFFTDQACKALEIEDNVNLTLTIRQTLQKSDKQQNQDLENTLKDMTFCHLQENLGINMVNELMDTATKTGIDAAKTTLKRVVQKTAEATGHLIGNKIADKITSLRKTKTEEKENTNKQEQIYIPPEKRQQIY